ncbi:hydroxyectoine utilization dehydratase EutB [Nitratireductor rhodophyticola]|uniref:hydroxyectoine utilization dehydratase EutB n=1 Tax=Nitratireductor rhodophyticola TaxID=2854036 RepID=UPI002AC96826|nr:hydroxyectoine utilization dehydratase EutB [Nitratireductor rhodophyticola]WPZ13750.1 hydroxyectoine utilization dehydratase EutB [Nitratireductor rhodophyticola]
MTHRAALALADILAARRRIAGIATRDTPLPPSPFLSRLAGDDVLLKLEIGQASGAFKLRGAANAVLTLPDDATGVTCCSTGNHGRAVAYAARARGLRAVICMSKLVPEAKIAGIRALGAEARIIGASQDEAQVESRRLADEEGFCEISPFDDLAVIAGQGTIGLELLEQRPDLQTVLIPLSGGGLAGGIAFALKTIKPSIRVIGITMERGAAMHTSLAAGKPVAVTEVASLADSLGGGIGLENRHSFELCRNHLDDVVLVTEEEIYRAMQAHYFEDRLVCEGASAVGAAALMAGKISGRIGPTATLITGRNIDMQVFTDIVCGRDVALGDTIIKGAPHAA